MATINQSLALLASALFSPRDQKPTLDQRWTQLTWEFQNLVNELNNTNQPWLTQTTTVNVNSGAQDYIVPGNIGKVLFVYANLNGVAQGPVGMEFADLASVSSDFYLYSPLDYGIAPDFNEAFIVPFPAQLAFYRQGGSVYFRLPPFGTGIESVSIISSVGDWLDGLTSDDEFVLRGHSQLAIVRAALNLLPGCEWSGDDAFNQKRGENLVRSLAAQEERYAAAWHVTKRHITGDDVSYRIPVGGSL